MAPADESTGVTAERLPATVSVIIPAYKAARYIAEALDSVLAQTFSGLEVIVVNDCSPDTEQLNEVLEGFRGRVTYIQREKNGGPGAARNTGIVAARGEYLAFLDADDYWEPTYLAEQLDFLGRHPDVSLVYTDASWFIEGSRKVVGTLMTAAPSNGEPTFESLLSLECTVGTSAVLVRRQPVLDVGLFDEDIGNYSEDYDLYLRLAQSGARLAYQRRLLVHHRLHQESLLAEPLELPQGVLRVLGKTAARTDLTPEQRTRIEGTRARIQADLDLLRAQKALERREFDEALRGVRAAHDFHRSWKLKLVMLALRLSPGLLLQLHKRRRT